MTDWALWMAAWVIQDGNYPNFARGQRLEVAVEFYAPDGFTTGTRSRSAVADADGWYLIDGTVVAVLDAVWVIDCGLLIYDDDPPDGVQVGDSVRGRALLSVDPFMYFESFAKRAEMPELIYTWELHRIRRETAPRVRDHRGRLVRQESKRGLVDMEVMDAWSDDGGFAEYRLDCQLLDVAPKRTSATAT